MAEIPNFGGTGSQRRKLRRWLAREGQEIGTLPVPPPPAPTPPKNPPNVPLTRSSVEFYVGVVLTAIPAALALMGVTINFWAACLLWLGIAYVCVDLVRHSPWTIAWSSKAKVGFCLPIVSIIGIVIFQGYVISKRPSEASQLLRITREGTCIHAGSIVNELNRKGNEFLKYEWQSYLDDEKKIAAAHSDAEKDAISDDSAKRGFGFILRNREDFKQMVPQVTTSRDQLLAMWPDGSSPPTPSEETQDALSKGLIAGHSYYVTADYLESLINGACLKQR